jgi:MFS superfamily sulfate permease-like transporter
MSEPTTHGWLSRFLSGQKLDSKTLAGELLASVVVFLVALPLCMGIAIASNVPPALGIISGIIGGIVIGALAGSPLQVSGPAAGLAVIVFDIVRDQGIQALGPIVLIAGMLQIAAGLLRTGQWFRAVSPAVIRGMLSGIGLLILVSQFHVMIDDRPRESGIKSLLAIPEGVAKAFAASAEHNHHLAAILGITTIAVMVLWSAYRPAKLRAVPPALVAVVTAAAVTALFKLPVDLVSVPASLVESANWLPFDRIGDFMTPTIFGEAFGIALIASAETLLSATAVDQLHNGPRTNYDKELVAQGAGNIVAGFFGSLPITGVIVRSSANVEAGSRTRLSTIFHGFWLIATIVALPWLLKSIPTASLAAILVYTGYKLLNPAGIRELWRFNRAEGIIFFGTLIGIVTTDLLKGVVFGLVLALARLVWRAARMKERSQGLLARLINLDIKTQLHEGEQVMTMTLRGSANFLKLPLLAKALERLPEGHEIRVNIDALAYIDHACMELFDNWESSREAFGNTLVLDRAALMSRYTGEPWTGGPVRMGASH